MRPKKKKLAEKVFVPDPNYIHVPNPSVLYSDPVIDVAAQVYLAVQKKYAHIVDELNRPTFLLRFDSKVSHTWQVCAFLTYYNPVTGIETFNKDVLHQARAFAEGYAAALLHQRMMNQSSAG